MGTLLEEDIVGRPKRRLGLEPHCEMAESDGSREPLVQSCRRLGTGAKSLHYLCVYERTTIKLYDFHRRSRCVRPDEIEHESETIKIEKKTSKQISCEDLRDM